ncbi:hypothetical protein NQ166_07575 [Microbacterium sp. zg.Y1090]|uniref:hypothetical protein n=1 Tax=Microbacterium TaxID=33882 RepID=UPI00214C252A|nr:MULTISPECIES: hypothetical protein [unclassified Microbacterium]MCR2811862.1 hypothetical protein [Microbacterium sp. zg.Y1084]MCR2818699.1 hypothetical protein [Microbacterium sp. zg.Y1090]MDL5486512.1 hypothetical protein [Microbacterium sp. zg-Y1211]WIM27020.1 hypothetical protein QNO26_07385 [Microbacterium sp. zg-Y1090]
MFIVYSILFLLGFYLFGLAFLLDSGLSPLVFVGGVLAVSAALALVVHGPGGGTGERAHH